MKWTEEVQLRFNELRQKELAGTLSANKKAELAELFTVIGADEERYLAGVIAQMQAEQRAREAYGQANQHLQQRNTELKEEIVYLQALIH